MGNDTPVFFSKDPKKFSDFIHTQKRDPRTNCKSPTMMWDFWSLNPESLHRVAILMSDRGTPASYRNLNGYSSHTFSMVNAKNERVWVKFYFKTAQGIKNFTDAEVEQSAFVPAHVIDGIGYSFDRMLQGRLLYYPDAHRYRFGANYEQIPVNKYPYTVSNYERDGYKRVDGNGGSDPNYHPNSFDDIYVDE